jgi:hypothetical protein
MPKVDRLFSLLLAIFDPLLDALRFIRLSLQQRCTLAAENLFLRKQLALYLERQVEPRRPRAAAKLTLVLLSRLFPWRQALTIVKPDTFVRWHRQGFRLFWKWKSRPRGRPRIPAELQKLIVEMANDNPASGEERIAAELLLKVGIRISPRTVGRYMPKDRGPQRGPSSQRWMTFVRNHAKGILACDFFVTVTASFRVLYVFVNHGGGDAQDRSRQRHSSSHSGLDPSAGSRGRHWRETLSVSRPRSRQHLLFRVRFSCGGNGLEHSQNAIPNAPSECILRAVSGKHST